MLNTSFPKQPPEVFCGSGCSWGFRGINRRDPVSGCLFNKVAGLRLAALLKGRLCFSCGFYEIFGSTFLGRLLLSVHSIITCLSEICLTSLIALIWNFPLMICDFPLLLSHSKNIRMSTLIIITKNHNNYCSVRVIELCLLNLLILIDCFLCNSYPCVLL